MATDPYDDILKCFDGLSPTKRQELLAELERRQAKHSNDNNGRTLLDAFKDHGMVGSITDAPEDWSTNPKYMEGFGNASRSLSTAKKEQVLAIRVAKELNDRNRNS